MKILVFRRLKRIRHNCVSISHQVGRKTHKRRPPPLVWVLLMILRWLLPEPVLILSERRLFSLLLAVDTGSFFSGHSSCHGQKLWRRASPWASYHEHCGQDPCKNTCDKKLKPMLDVQFVLGAFQIGRLPEHSVMVVSWQPSLRLQGGLGGQFKHVILYCQLAYPPTTGRKLSDCPLCEQGALFSAVTWK